MAKTKAKTKPKKSSPNPQKISLVFPLLLVLSFIVLAYVLIYKPDSLTNQLSVKIPNLISKTAPASAAAQVKEASASTKPLATIPQNYGKSVHVPILTYHYIRTVPDQKDTQGLILSVDPSKFDTQMGYLASQGFNPITFDTLYAALYQGVTLPNRPIILSFDDGYIDFYINAYPILKKYGFHAVAFIPTGLIGSSYYLHWDQIKDMDQSGLISFQAHSISHPNLTALSFDREASEIADSKHILEAQLGKTVNTFAYPYGASNQTSWELVKKAGYIGAVGTWFGTIESEGNIYDMPRVKIAGGIDLPTYINLVNQ